MKIEYTSENGYRGIMSPGNFLGFKHWDLSIFDPDGKFVYHATLEEKLPTDEFVERVDEFPQFRQMLLSKYERKEDK